MVDAISAIGRDEKLRGDRYLLMLKEIPYLNLAQVYAALSYYHANRNEIEADLATKLAEYQRLEAEDRAGNL